MDAIERELVALLATHVPTYFRQVVLHYQHRLYSFALRLTGSTHDAEDVVQEAFINAYAALLNYPASRIQMLHLQPWLYRVTLNTFRHHVRGRHLQLVPLDLSAESPVLELEDTEQMLPETCFENKERLRELEDMVARLPERYRTVIICHYFEHLTYLEIAELLDEPVGTIKSAISRGVRQLRTMLSTEEQGDKKQYC